MLMNFIFAMVKLSFLENYKKVLTLHLIRVCLKVMYYKRNVFPKFSQIAPQIALSMFEPSVAEKYPFKHTLRYFIKMRKK